MKRHIPNVLTLLNVFCGTIAVMFAVKNELEIAAIFVFAGIIFDFFDGLVARWLRVQSELGVQLDSLADMITCGVVPGIVMFQLLRMSNGFSWEEHGTLLNGMVGTEEMPWIAFAGLLITLGSAYRLAKFNIDEDQVSSFIGLPTPANTLFIISLPLILAYQGNDAINAIIVNQWFLLGVTVLSTYMLNARVPLFALKFKDWSLKKNATRYSFLALCVFLLIVMHFAAVPVIIVLYVILSALDRMATKKA